MDNSARHPAKLFNILGLIDESGKEFDANEVKTR